MSADGKHRTRNLVAPVLRERSQELRQAMSGAEQLIWRHLRAHRFHNLGFRRQVPIAGYIVDFVCHECRLIVEIDGSTHGSDEAVNRDAVRTQRLEAEGYRLLRYWNNDIMSNIEGVLLDLAVRSGRQDVPLNPPALGQGAR